MQYTKLTFCSLLVLQTALASISLENIETLDSTKVTPGCFNAYNHEIDNCTMSEVSSGICSSGCISALESFADTVILTCRQYTPIDGSLLRKIDDGELVDTLCTKTTKDDDTHKTTTPTTTTTTATTTTTSSVIEKTFNETVTPTLTTDSTAIKTTSGANTASSTGARTTDDTILGGSENAAPGAKMGMGVIIAVAIAIVAAMF